jgi:chemotaxis protein MotA
VDWRKGGTWIFMGDTMTSLFDPAAMIVVLAGTLLASVVRCGLSNWRSAAVAVAGLARPRFDQHTNRAALARLVQDIARRGRHAVDGPLPKDRALAGIAAAFLRLGEIEHLRDALRTQRAVHLARRKAAVRVFTTAGELAPIFGLVGTLFGITRLAPVLGASGVDATSTAIATAVLSSLYGVLLAHLVCLPLASAIERRANREERERRELVEWFELQLRLVIPGLTLPPRQRDRARLQEAA